MSDRTEDLPLPPPSPDKRAAGLILVVIGVPLDCVGGLALLWSLFCFLGGPDGKIGSWDAIAFGSVFGTIGIVFVAVGVLLGKRGLRLLRSST
jgi:hypothetical protein